MANPERFDPLRVLARTPEAASARSPRSSRPVTEAVVAGVSRGGDALAQSELSDLLDILISCGLAEDCVPAFNGDTERFPPLSSVVPALFARVHTPAKRQELRRDLSLDRQGTARRAL